MDLRDAMQMLKGHLGGVVLGLDESVSKSLTQLVRLSDLQPATMEIRCWADGTFEIELMHYDTEERVRWSKIGNGPSVMIAAGLCLRDEWTNWAEDDVEQIEDDG